MRGVFTLTTSESKRLIGKAVSQMETVQKSMKKGKIVITMSTTNAYVVEELLNTKIEKQKFATGITTKGVQCSTQVEERLKHVVLQDGVQVDMDYLEAVKKFDKNDILIKGANAIDHCGNVGVLLGNDEGGTIGSTIGILSAKGSQIIVPVGLEKLIPSVKDASKLCGIDQIDMSFGMKVGYMVLANTNTITEITALKLLCNVTATHIASGGVGGSEGSITLVIEGEDNSVRKAFNLIRSIKGEPPIGSMKQKCGMCNNKCNLFADVTK